MADLTHIEDIDHVYGQDIGLSPTGDLGSVIGSTRSEQRVLRRLQTASSDGGPADYLANPDYGGSIPRDVGSVLSPQAIQSKIKGQMLAEVSVVQDPAPVITFTPEPNGVLVEIDYLVAPDRTPAVAAFKVST